MRVVSTVEFGWGIGDTVQRWFASKLSRRPGWLITLRVVWWSVCHPFHTGGASLSVWLWLRGWPVPVAIFVGTLPPVLWAFRGVVRVAAVPKGPQHILRTLEAFRRWRCLERNWERAATYAGLTNKDGKVPRLLNVSPTETGIEALVINGAVGATVEKLNRAADTVAASIPGCRGLSVSEADTLGRAWLHFQWADPLGRTIKLARLPLPSRGRLAFGLTSDGEPATIAANLSLFVAGRTGSGKSTVLWGLIASALATGTPVRFYVIDPSGGVELHALENSPLVVSYASRVRKDTKKTVGLEKTANQVISECHEAMEKRLARMSGKTRLHRPSETEPLIVLLIDEMLKMNHKLTPDAREQLHEIVSMGRKAAFAVWALAQLTAKEDIGSVRDLFPQRLCLASPNRAATNTILGDEAEASGAKASQIRIPGQEGVGYAAIDDIPGLARFRGVMVTNSEVDLISKGMLPPRVQRERAGLGEQPHVMYHWYSPDGELIYIGISNDGPRRTLEHLRDKEWASEPGVTCKIVDQFDTQDEALAAEKTAIETFRPRENYIHNPDHRDRRKAIEMGESA